MTNPSSVSSKIVRVLSSIDEEFDTHLSQLLCRDVNEYQHIEQSVVAIINDIRARGDEALVEYTRKFDNANLVNAGDLEVSWNEINHCVDIIDSEQRTALEHARDRIIDFHQRQKEDSWSYQDESGSRYGQVVSALERVGVYVPGGKAAYPSSVLMNAIPARVAGVEEIVMVVPTPGGYRNPMVMAAAAIAGVDRVFAIGGAQAIAALAYGTTHVPRVDKIVGPGNIYVATAKRQVFGQVGIDMIAGPSEVVVICDAGADPEWVAMDLFAQAEHDEMAQSIVICDDSSQLQRVLDAVARLLPELERREVIEKSLTDHGAAIIAQDMDDALAITNRIAPEHLELQVANPEPLLEKVRHAGAIFAGYYSAESLGDYCAGPNHVLPTAGTARFSSPLGVYDFQKRSSLVMCSREGASRLSSTASVLARAEYLTAHARSAELRR
ncbi:MAG: histidinol dehydrogenase [marine bacterium B5-7]|nr:MAG: histidinol dehydrogenase [marine bacterium B5-7]